MMLNDVHCPNVQRRGMYEQEQEQKREQDEERVNYMYYVFHILPQIYTENHATFPIQMYASTV